MPIGDYDDDLTTRQAAKGSIVGLRSITLSIAILPALLGLSPLSDYADRRRSLVRRLSRNEDLKDELASAENGTARGPARHVVVQK